MDTVYRNTKQAVSVFYEAAHNIILYKQFAAKNRDV